jgi:hypothetical protein
MTLTPATGYLTVTPDVPASRTVTGDANIWTGTVVASGVTGIAAADRILYNRAHVQVFGFVDATSAVLIAGADVLGKIA